MQAQQIFNPEGEGIAPQVPHDRSQPWGAHRRVRGQEYTWNRPYYRWEAVCECLQGQWTYRSEKQRSSSAAELHFAWTALAENLVSRGVT